MLCQEANQSWTQTLWFLLGSFTDWNVTLFIHTFHSKPHTLVPLGQPSSSTSLMIINTDYDLCLQSVGWYLQYNGSVKELNKFHNYETEEITRKARDGTEYMELFGSSTQDHHARRINVILWTISGGRTEQHVIMGFGELAVVD